MMIEFFFMPEISHYNRLNAAHIQSKCVVVDMESLNGNNFLRIEAHLQIQALIMVTLELRGKF